MAPRVSNIMLYVADIERAKAFYRDVVGLSFHGSGGTFAFFDGGDVTVALSQLDEPPPGGGTELVLEVDDVHAEYERLRNAGVGFRVEPRTVTSSGGRDLVAADFRDPDGHVVSITSWMASSR